MKIGIGDLTLKWNNHNKFGELSISISGLIASFSAAPHI